MKLLKSLVLVVAASLMMTACGGGSTPSEVVNNFYEATIKVDFAAAKKYVAKDLQESYDKAAELSTSQQFQAIKSLMSQAKFEVLGEEIAEDGNTATVKVKVSAMGQEQEEEVPLVKEDGKWKVNQPADLGK